jgi:hypothetical protein
MIKNKNILNLIKFYISSFFLILIPSYFSLGVDTSNTNLKELKICIKRDCGVFKTSIMDFLISHFTAFFIKYSNIFHKIIFAILCFFFIITQKVKFIPLKRLVIKVFFEILKEL